MKTALLCILIAGFCISCAESPFGAFVENCVTETFQSAQVPPECMAVVEAVNEQIQPPTGLNIELVFLEDVGDRESVYAAAALWSERIEAVQPVRAKFDTRNAFYFDWEQAAEMPNTQVDQVIEGALIFVGLNETRIGRGFALLSWFDENDNIIQPDTKPRAGYISLPAGAYYEGSQESARVELAAHEIAHALGVSYSIWHQDVRQRANDRWHHVGANCRQGYRDMGATSHQYIAGAPLANDRSHWHPERFSGALMAPVVYEGSPITAVTLGALADVGWPVKMETAQPFSLRSAKALNQGWACHLEVEPHAHTAH